MKLLLFFLIFSFLSYSQDSIEFKRFFHEFQLNVYSASMQAGGYELDYQICHNFSDKIYLGGRIGFFYNQRGDFRYSMLPLYLTSEFPFGERKKTSVCLDVGTPLLLNEDSNRMNTQHFWASTDYIPSDYGYRKRIVLITQFSFKFKIYKGIRVAIGVNNYWGSKRMVTEDSWYATFGLKGGVSYVF